MQIRLSGDSVDSRGQTITYTTWDSITVRAIGHEGAPLYDNSKNISSLQLSLHTGAYVTAWQMVYHNLTDTLYIEHTDSTVFHSLACGDITTHRIITGWSTGDGWITEIILDKEMVTTETVDNVILRTRR